MALSDNSVLTTNKFLTSFKGAYALEGEQTVLLSVTGGLHYDAMSGQAPPEFLCRWLNSWLLRSPIEKFPDDIVSQSGKQIFECIEFLSGKSLDKVMKWEWSQNQWHNNNNTNKEMQKIQTWVAQYEQVLNFLKWHGCLLSMVKPEALLSGDNYVKYCMWSFSGSKKSLEKTYA